MIANFKASIVRTAPTLVEDALGCMALVVVLYVGLVLPGLV